MTLEIAVVGGRGRLGRALARWSRHRVRCLGSTDCDVREPAQIAEMLDRERPSVAINCAAITDQAVCEGDPDRAWAINVAGALALARACQDRGVFVVHMSSDAVLDPVNVYARSKKASEESGADLCVRTSFYDETHWIIRRLQEARALRLLTTNELNPISSWGLVTTLDELVEASRRGTVEVGTSRKVSSYEFGRAIAGALGLEPALVEPVATLEETTTVPTHRFLARAFAWTPQGPPDLETDLAGFLSTGVLGKGQASGR